MSNLNIENLNRIVQTGDVEGLMGVNPGVRASEVSVAREMQNQGMEMPGVVAGGDKTFSAVLRSSMDQVNLHQNQADQAVKELVSGRTKNIHETMLAIERADASLKLMMQVRNKILDAYKEVMRMQV
ncbi:MAG: flagellar hook-basal body complex protein FliE [Bdellovibrionota bacterium]